MSTAGWDRVPIGAESLEGGLGMLRGLAFATAVAGVRESAHRDPTLADVALIDIGRPVPAAVVTTTNQVRAAPCDVAVAHVAAGGIRAVIVNSGNANACTGPRGRSDAERMAAETAAALGCEAQEVVPMSTGVIGVPLPVERIAAAVPALIRALAPGSEAAAMVARAMMTTDTRPKQVAVRRTTPAGTVTVAGVAKGAGMIEPAMATMLSVIVTDAALDAAGCEQVLRAAVTTTFNRISVDSCGSTNDTVLLLATGDGPHLAPDDVVDLVAHVAALLARMVVLDGEGVSRVAALRVCGAPDDAAAEVWGRAIAASALFRTALHGSDPNWGRILAAMGTTSAPFDPASVTVAFGPITVCRDGAAVPYDRAAAIELLREREVDITVTMGAGDGEALFLVADLSAGYVTINAEYTT
jgi:glutamate N-acetyltransferase / amino-acid N-acetyltransferase